MDVQNAFLQGNLNEEIYMELPSGLHNQGEHQSKHDYTLFTKQQDMLFINLLVYVDDILIIGNDNKAINSLKTYLHQTFRIKDLEEPKYFLGIEVARTSSGILLSQRKYVLELISDSGLSGCKPNSIPIEQNTKLTSQEFNDSTKSPKEDPQLQDHSKCQRLVVRLIYLIITRPDINYVVQILSQFMHSPKQSHMDAVIKVVKYLKGSLRLGLFLKGNLDLTTFCDSDWGSYPMTRKSLTGFCIKLGKSLISWKTKKTIHSISIFSRGRI
ncbi:uncharacterized mitochondrial protein AtMg00810-like [Mangifera indica]|uniref:uncharacterized mitochondrial protein AtMg00810-like n=1 Tax=Mangifera indica TaxID=29780 RepID=UPI001CF9C775|nr:uncharacterized mitochondrial protein AtMg00810-like [Mangifera indica]